MNFERTNERRPTKMAKTEQRQGAAAADSNSNPGDECFRLQDFEAGPAPNGKTSRRSSKSSQASGISFECHSSVVLEELSAMLDEQLDLEEEQERSEAALSANPQEDVEAALTQRRRSDNNARPLPVVTFSVDQASSSSGVDASHHQQQPHRRSSNFSAGTAMSSAYSSNGDLSLNSIAEDSHDGGGSVSSNTSYVSITRRYEARAVRRAISSGNVGMFRSHSHAGFALSRRNNSFIGRVVRSASGGRVHQNQNGRALPGTSSGTAMAGASPPAVPSLGANATFGGPNRRRHIAAANGGTATSNTVGAGRAAENPFLQGVNLDGGANFVKLLNQGRQ